MKKMDQRREEEEEEEIWSWGAGTEGQLATTKLEDEHSPQLLHFPSLPVPGLASSISLLSCGGAHVLALTSCGKVLTWGRGTSGQLGHGDIHNSLHPKLVNFFDGLVLSHFSAGWNHSGFVADNGRVYTCGDGSFGQLGHGDYESQSTPKLVSYFNSKLVDQIACGMRHSLVLLRAEAGDSADQVYGFGLGKRGQLGVSTEKIKSIGTPQVTLGLEDCQVVNISANGDHSAALAVDGHLYTWGRGFRGCPDAHFPRCFPSSLQFTQVALGWNHALVLTDDGELFMLGNYHHGGHVVPQKVSEGDFSALLDDPGDMKQIVLVKVPNPDGTRILHIAAGAEHSAIVTDDGIVQTWGWGEHGQLGLGNTNDQTRPMTVSLARKMHINTRVHCGSGFTFVLRTRML